MNETILLYNLKDNEKGKAINAILHQLGIKIVNVESHDILHPIGYLLTIDGYEPTTKGIKEEKIEDEMLVIHNFSDEQIQVMLEIFKGANIPLIPLKAVVTPTNVDWSFYALYQEIKKEHKMMANMKAGK